MRDQDYEEFLTTLVALAEALGPKELSEAMLQIYWNALKEMTIEQFRMAVEIVVKTGRFFPRPAEIIEAVTPDLEANAIVAIDRLTDALASIGTYKTVTFDDPAINATVESMGGWIELGQKEIDEWFRKEFIKIYKAHAKRVRSRDFSGIPHKLLGRNELANTTKGYKTEPAIVIGNHDRALTWVNAAKAYETGEGKIGMGQALAALNEAVKKLDYSGGKK